MITVIPNQDGNRKVIVEIQIGLDQRGDPMGYYNSENKKFKDAITIEPHPSLKQLVCLQVEFKVDLTTFNIVGDVFSSKPKILTQNRNISSNRLMSLNFIEDICVVTLLWVLYVMAVNLVFSYFGFKRTILWVNRQRTDSYLL